MINRVLLYNSGGGIGDAIQILPLINTLKNELKNTKFYYLSAHENHFNSTLKDLNCEIESLNLKITFPLTALRIMDKAQPLKVTVSTPLMPIDGSVEDTYT